MPDTAERHGLVLDTSVWINLLATEALGPILAGIGVSCYAPEQVVAELKRHPVTGRALPLDAHPLRMDPLIKVAVLDPKEVDLFLEIVGASASDALGDGEAAAIAVAASRNLELVVDDKKARRVVRQRFGHLRIHWTVDLLRNEGVRNRLGEGGAEDCWEKARRFGRMHVPR